MLALILAAPGPARAFDPAVLDSVVSVLPRHAGGAPRRQAPGPSLEPEGTAVAVAGGHLVTADHVVAGAEGIDIRLADGRVRSARLAGRDPASDLALLRADPPLPALPWGNVPGLGEEVCAAGNAFGLGLSVVCGVVSARRITHAGFNRIEDFTQTDAAVNPGMSGAPLVDRQGRLVGIVTGIFTRRSDADVGVNFASTPALVRRVIEDLARYGEVRRTWPDWRLAALPREARRERVGARVVRVGPGGAAAAAGLRAGDLVTAIDGRRVGRPSDARAAVQLRRPGDWLAVRLRRDARPRTLWLQLPPWPPRAP